MLKKFGMDLHMIPSAIHKTGDRSAAEKSPTDHWVRYRLYAFALGIALLAVIVWPFDQTVSDALRLSVDTPNGLLFWHLAQMVKFFGKGDILFLLGCVLAINHWKRAAVLACLAMFLVSPIIGPSKLIFGRERPDRTNTGSFPSGDAAAITAFLVPIATVLPATKPIVIVGVAAIGMERVALRKHFPSDVLAGIAIGVFVSAVVLSLTIPLRPRIRRFLRRSWLAAGLGLLVPIYLLLRGSGDMKRFLVIFGPAVVLLVIAPFVRSWMRTLGRVHIRLSKGREHILALVLAAIVFMGLLFAIVLIVGPWLLPLFRLNLPVFEPEGRGLIWSITALGWTLFVMTLLALKEHAARRYRSSVGILVAGMVCLIFIVTVLALPIVERFKVSKPLADAIRRRTVAEFSVAEMGGGEPSLIFYLGQKHMKSIGGDAEVIAWAKENQTGILIVSRKALTEVEARSGPLGLEEVGAARGFNYSKGRWIDVIALGRKVP